MAPSSMLARWLVAACFAALPACILLPAGYHHSKQLDACIEECDERDPEARCHEEGWDSADTGVVEACVDCCELMYSR